ncbi:hypothetical protein [Alkalitalea saponilacus]|uniref:PEGA domain-containing protein n=1 Tax=Alkalitalea saponilacus TaxID=889453 RepID=A0A1T5ESP3_9BACT|nr:hypothetical protein [Alkalitalea saponilacus]ASB48043.1 hypothetical protein CDL62_02225 [Alkalitalea saponilacus]SKB86957.1 hypothetical protein SAMN03080601_01377 [Alkalitalea saponilacus]
MAQLIITRSNEVTNRTVDYSIWIDGKNEGIISNAGRTEIQLKEGSHSFQIKSSTESSAIIPLSISNDKPVSLHVSMNRTGRWILPIGVTIIGINFILKRITEDELPAFIMVPSLFAVLLLYVYYRTIGRRKSIRIEKRNNN